MIRLCTSILAVVLAAPAAAFNTNPVYWADDQLPVPFELVTPGSDDLGMEATEEVVLAALDQWAAVSCTYLEFEFLGWVDEVVFGDGIVQVQWIEEDWVGDQGIAGATGIQIDPFEERVTDVNLLMNGEYLQWSSDASDPYHSPMILDVQAVLAHEFGHVFGLDHNDDMIEATMFWGYTSAAGGWLSWDDKWGICHLYPAEGDECQVDEDCPDHPDQEYVCREIEELGRRVCEEQYDDLGACCDPHWNNCGDVLCHGYWPNYDGHCTWFCEDEVDCPPTWTCEEVTYLGEARMWCVSPEGSDQACGEDFVWPEESGDDDDSAGDDDTSGDDDSAAADDDDDGCACESSPPRPASGSALVLLALALASRRRRP